MHLGIIKSIICSRIKVGVEDFDLSENFWQVHKLLRGDTFENANNKIYFIAKGAFREYIKVHGTKEEITIFFYPKDNILLFNDILEAPNGSHYLQALEPSLVYALNLRDLMSKNKSADWVKLETELVKIRSQNAFHRIYSLLTESPQERYVKFIEDQSEISSLISLNHLASFLGIERPSLSRIRSRIQTSRMKA